MLESGDLVLLVSPKGKRYLRQYDPKTKLHTQEGVLDMAEVQNAGYGGVIATHLGHPFRILRPSTYELIKGVKRSTQIMYPKEIGYVLLKLGIGPGARVVEAGSGSGGLTLAMAYHVGDTGRVYTFERRAEFFDLAGKNLAAAGLGHRVTRFHHDISEGFFPDGMIPGDPATDPSRADALFLDVRTPWEHLEQAAAVICPGAPVGFLLPTTNQISDLLRGLENAPFADVEVLEILVRRYKPVADRLRPEDRMVAHTGFLVFARHAGTPLPHAEGAPDTARPGETSADPTVPPKDGPHQPDTDQTVPA
ncbi:tRNA (adenine-N1)-methyltransferase [Desulfolutivibrio sulfoxidireducens]|uniref:tRNA (adenine-N1)-methyltransferase n=1 Tax=Desulfolutivibrio sulfoxidireducens TaxID=2773299 RepID=UPI00159DB2B5|nr:tRNA (adenine-N1)-methyltransferase [Desulfolutivibrio sulfoxidireducens]QLA19644.1 tRNA (adenine-N1)-methyltransferase [Desulfolutivibrio sulfoxidireducens]